MSQLKQQFEQARALDSADPLKGYRQQFSGLDHGLVYLDGNSLGPLPARTAKLLRDAVEVEWGQQLIQSWNAGWYDLPERLGNLLAPLLGASEGEVIFSDSVTVNLFKLAASALHYKTGRKQVLTDDLNFPSDYYALDGLIRMLGQGHELVRVSSGDGISLEADQLAASMNKNTALVTVSHVVFKSGYMHDLEAITRAAHAKGALVMADLSHSVGAVPIDLEQWGVDLAIGCSYKYLNGGPGAPAFLYVRKSLQERLQPQLAGWFGTQDPFSFRPDYAPVSGIRKFMVGTPPILSLRAVEPGIQLLRDAGMGRIRDKSVLQTGLLIELWERFLKPLGFELGTPLDPSVRGSHIALRHPEAFRINKALISPPDGRPVVIPDFRTPDNLRLGIAPLFLSFEDIVHAVERIREIVVNSEYKSFNPDADGVT